jgi:hypothetical protein
MTPDASAMFDRMYRQLVAERHIAASVPAQAAGGRYFRGRLLPFQTEGVAFLCAVRKGLLADDMGLRQNRAGVRLPRSHLMLIRP